jgi:predicted lipid-binding transport protein (Tim44 family)
MKTWLMAALVAGLAVALTPIDADARRLGGGKPAGMQRSVPDKQPAQTPPTATPNNAQPNNPGTPAAAAAPANAGAAAAAAPKRSWLGPVAGLAAGLGLAALFSHLGMGEGLANFVMLLLLAMVAFVAIRWLLRRFAGNGASTARLATAGAGTGSFGSGPGSSSQPLQRTAWSSSPAAAPQLPAAGAAALAPSQPALPADFDATAFQRIAKMIFIRLQAANDKSDLNDLRAFTTPELFASLRLDLQERGNSAQQTDVVSLDAELVDFAQENDRQIVSVRFHGLLREEAASGAAPFDEVWHLVRPLDGGGSAWAIAGIQPRQ